MNNLDLQYINLAKYILEHGNVKADRTGTGTISIFGWTIRHKMSEGFPLITTKKMAWKQIVTELLWLLRGDTNIKWLVDHGNNIWVGDAYKRYVNVVPEDTKKCHDVKEFIEKIKESDIDSPFVQHWGNLGPIYGKQWRNWATNKQYTKKTGETYPSGEFKFDVLYESIDQIKDAINTLKKNPDSRRIMVNAWNVAEIDKMTLPPCHYGFQFYTRLLSIEERIDLASKHSKFDVLDFGIGKQEPEYAEEHLEQDHLVCDGYDVPRRAISLKWDQRSVDVPLGLPFNIASYGLLLLIVANEVKMLPEEIIGNLGDTHIYLNQTKLMQEQITRSSFALPHLKINDEFWNPNDVLDKENSLIYVNALIEGMQPEDFILENYHSQAKINYPLSN